MASELTVSEHKLPREEMAKVLRDYLVAKGVDIPEGAELRELMADDLSGYSPEIEITFVW